MRELVKADESVLRALVAVLILLMFDVPKRHANVLRPPEFQVTAHPSTASRGIELGCLVPQTAGVDDLGIRPPEHHTSKARGAYVADRIVGQRP